MRRYVPRAHGRSRFPRNSSLLESNCFVHVRNSAIRRFYAISDKRL
ncbi:hypothetical protein HMPREF3190_01333 [Umbribacter vaginalis]|nr:hypothetical protein HMPREF3190_01333 [Coriobacteriales bacterium DNF00809]